MANLTKEQKQSQFVEAVEQILGFYLLPWQRDLVIEIRSESLAGRELNIQALAKRVRDERDKKAAAVADGGKQ